MGEAARVLDKYTKLHVELQEYIFESDLTKREIKALLYVNALTTGYRQTWSTVHPVPMAKALKMDESDARKTLASLVSKGALVVEQRRYAIALHVKVNHPDETGQITPENGGAGRVNHPAKAGQITPIGRVNHPEKQGKSPRSQTGKPASELLAAAPLKTLDNLTDNNQTEICAAPQHDPPARKRTVHEYPQWFEDLNKRAPWVDKWPAYKAAMRHRPDEAMIAAFNAGLDRWLTSQRWADGFICNGKTFFGTEKRWEQFPPQVGQPRGLPKPVSPTPSEAPKAARDYSW